MLYRVLQNSSWFMLYTAHTHGVTVWCFRFSFSLSQKFFLVHGKEYWRNEGDEDERKRIIHNYNQLLVLLSVQPHSQQTHSCTRERKVRERFLTACMPAYNTISHLFSSIQSHPCSHLVHLSLSDFPKNIHYYFSMHTFSS